LPFFPSKKDARVELNANGLTANIKAQKKTSVSLTGKPYS